MVEVFISVSRNAQFEWLPQRGMCGIYDITYYRHVVWGWWAHTGNSIFSFQKKKKEKKKKEVGKWQSEWFWAYPFQFQFQF